MRTHRDDVIRMAKEAGVINPSPYTVPWENEQLALERFAGLVAAAERDALAAKLSAAQGMADTMEMLRSEMIEAGVIDANVPPMFFPESIIPRLLRLKDLEGQAGPVRLTDDEIKSVLGLSSASGLAARIARLTEDAVLERNGLKPQAKGD